MPEVLEVLEGGEVIEEYQDDEPFPSNLVMGLVNGRPLHVVVAFNHAEEETIIVTVYEPNPREWSGDFRRRKP